MAIIVGRRDASPLISTAAPVHVPDKTPTEEFAQGAKAAYLTYALGKEVVTDASKLATLGVKAFQDTPQEKQAKFDEELKKKTEENYQRLREAKRKAEENNRRRAEMWKNRGDYLDTISRLKGRYSDPFVLHDVDQSIFKDADELMSQGKFFEAESAYRMLAAKFPDQGDKRSEEALRRAENAKNEFAFGRATSLEKAGKDAEAIEELDRLAESNPALKEEAEFRKSIISEAVAKEKQEAIYNASSWEEAQRIMRTEKFKELSPEESMRKVSADMAAAAMGPRPIAYKEVQAQALMAAAEQNPVKRNAMMQKVLSDFDKSGGVGVPIENFWDMWTGDHIVKARQSIINQFKITPTQAAKIMTEISTQAKNVAMAAESRKRESLMDRNAATNEMLAKARMRAASASASRARTARDEYKLTKKKYEDNEKLLNMPSNLTEEQKQKLTLKQRSFRADVAKTEAMADYYANLKRDGTTGATIKKMTVKKLFNLRSKRAELMGKLKNFESRGVLVANSWGGMKSYQDLVAADLLDGWAGEFNMQMASNFGMNPTDAQKLLKRFEKDGTRLPIFTKAENIMSQIVGLDEAIKQLEAVDKADLSKADKGFGGALAGLLTGGKGADVGGYADGILALFENRLKDIAGKGPKPTGGPKIVRMGAPEQ